MRKGLVWVFAAILLLSGCGAMPEDGLSAEISGSPDENAGISNISGTGAEEAVPEDVYKRLWAVNPCIDGYIRTDASRFVSWEGDHIRVQFSVSPETYAPALNNREAVNYQGRTFYLQEGESFWDGEDGSSGSEYIRKLEWREDGCAYSLAAYIDAGETALNIVCPETALQLETNNTSLEGLTVTYAGGYVKYRNGDCSVELYLYPPPFETDWLDAMIEESDDIVQKEDNGFIYYQRSLQRGPDDPNTAMMSWNTDYGMMYLVAGVPYDKRNDYPEDIWGFISPNFAREIMWHVEG